jgi:hypothetical protein
MSKNTVTTPEDKSVETGLSKFPKASNNRFLVLGFSNGNELAIIGEGEGAFAEAIAQGFVTEDAERYIILKKDLQVERAKTTKFAFVDHVPSGVKPTRRAMLSQLRSQIVAICKANTITITTEMSSSSVKDLDDKEIDDKVASASGIKSAVTDKKAEVKHHKEDPKPQSFIPAPTASTTTHANTRPKGTSVSGGQTVQSKIPTQTIKFTEGDEEKLKSAQKNLHETKDEFPWLVVSYSSKDTLTFVASGAGVDGLVAALDPEAQIPFYGLVRLDLSDGKSHTKKQILISYTNDSIPPLKKADATTKLGAITSALGTNHGSLSVTKPSDISESAIRTAK